MTKTIVNLALSVVIREVENVIDTYPAHPYQEALSIPEIRQRLISHVLSRIPAHYVVADDVEIAAIDTICFCPCAEEKLQIASLVRHGVEHILQKDSNQVDRHISHEINLHETNLHETSSGCAVSSWFG